MHVHSVAVRAKTSLIIALAILSVAASGFAQMSHDFLSSAEAEKIRDARFPNPRLHLYLQFAADRLKKFQYELQRKDASNNRGELLDGLMNDYSSCMDEASEQLDYGRDQGFDIRAGIKELQKVGKEDSAELQKIKALASPYKDDYSDTLDDAIEATHDALDSANAAAKAYGPAPVRRKP